MNGDEYNELPEAEIARRRDAALLRALSMPHKKQADMKIGKEKNFKAEATKRRDAKISK